LGHPERPSGKKPQEKKGMAKERERDCWEKPFLSVTRGGGAQINNCQMHEKAGKKSTIESAETYTKSSLQKRRALVRDERETTGDRSFRKKRRCA